MIADQVKAATKGKKKMTITQLVQAMEEPATQDLRGYRLLPTILQGDRHAEVGAAAQAIASCGRWHARGGHRRDLNRDGVDEEDAASS